MAKDRGLPHFDHALFVSHKIHHCKENLVDADLWFTEERNLEVLIEVNPKTADYFKRRKIFPTQEIKETKPDGSLVVSLKVGNYGEVWDILKSWLPNIRIIGPEALLKSFSAEIKKWLSWQTSSNLNMQV